MTGEKIEFLVVRANLQVSMEFNVSLKRRDGAASVVAVKRGHGNKPCLRMCMLPVRMWLICSFFLDPAS